MIFGWREVAVLPLLLCVGLSALHAQAPHTRSRTLKRDQGYDALGSHPVDDAVSDLEHFVTRRDIVAPRWDIRVYDEDALAPGYWFVAPYQDARQERRGGAWVGPHIYDASGELVWSGAPLFYDWVVFDFRAYRSHGSAREDMLSLVLRHEAGVLLDNTYQIQKESYISGDGRELNQHELHIVENSTRLLHMVSKETQATLEMSADIGYDGRCNVNFQGFEERDIDTLETTFTWMSEGIIPLSESFLDVTSVERRCERSPYDYLHCNSLDKFSDGDFLLACRHTDTVYKISKDDGSIVWRLGGNELVQSDFFLLNGHFGGQHAVKIWESNDTHTIIGMLDNALRIGRDKVSNDFSRGLLISLNMQEMTASIVARYAHPQHDLVSHAGNLQILPNGNVFLGFSDNSFIAEYANNGTLLLEASVRTDTKSYRAYKFPWTGHPTLPPDVYSFVSADEDSYRTQVYISWNGATEVARWRIHQANPDGSTKFTASIPKTGFETSITLDDYVSHVIVAAMDRNGRELGRSRITKTVGPAGVVAGLDAKDVEWIQDHPPFVMTFFRNPTVAFLAGIVLCAAMGLVGWFAWYLLRGARSSEDTLPNSEQRFLLSSVSNDNVFRVDDEEEDNEEDAGEYPTQKERDWG